MRRLFKVFCSQPLAVETEGEAVFRDAAYQAAAVNVCIKASQFAAAGQSKTPAGDSYTLRRFEIFFVGSSFCRTF